MQNFSKILSVFSLLLIFSCSQNKAPIVNRGPAVYSKTVAKNKKTANQNSVKKNINNEDSVAPSAKTIIITNGENIYSVARKYSVPMRDIINQNNLTPPYLLKTGDKIILPSSQYHQVETGDTLYSISRKYGMNINNLIALNDLEKPYGIKVGEKLKVKNSAENKSSVAYEEKESETAKETENKPAKPSKNLDEIKIANKNNHFIFPVKGPIISKFGPKAGGLYNDGINIKAKSGENVKATEDGVVAYVGNELRGYGNLVIIKHSGGWISAYGHLDKTKVKRGNKVKKGQNIASVGSTGNVKSPQLYFGLRKGREAVNPQNHILI